MCFSLLKDKKNSLIQNKFLFYPLIFLIFFTLSLLYYLKESKVISEFKQGFSNEPLLIYPEKYPENFSNDDYHSYGNPPYIPLHKKLLSFLWKDSEYERKYRLWLSILIFASCISLFYWFFILTRSRVISTCLAISCTVGYLENHWMFLIWGYSDINIAARQNFTVLIPVFLSTFFIFYNDYKRLIFFFLLLGISANLYPIIAIYAFIIFLLTYVFFNRFNKSSLLVAPFFIISFIAGSIPIFIELISSIENWHLKHQLSANYNIFIDKINTIIANEDLVSKYSGLAWNQGNNPLGSYEGLLRWFIFYPPLIILFSISLFCMFFLQSFPNLIKINKDFIKLLNILTVSTIVLILYGWLKNNLQFSYPLIDKFVPRSQYMGNFLFTLLFGYTSIFLTQLRNLNLKYKHQVLNKYKYLLVCVLIILVYQFYFLFLSSDNFLVYKLFTKSYVLWFFIILSSFLYLENKKNNLYINYFFIFIILITIASGFSFEYDEYKINFPLDNLKLNYLVLICFSLIMPASLIYLFFSIKNQKNSSVTNSLTVFILFLSVFSWQLPNDIYNNSSLVLGYKNQKILQKHEKNTSLREVANWVRSNTQKNARFLVTHDIQTFKFLALRSTPLLSQTEYEYFGDSGRIYANRNTIILNQILDESNFNKLIALKDELNAAYLLINKNYNPDIRFPKDYIIYENKNYVIYDLNP